MLEPDTRYLLFDSLRPPSGYKLDMAVGTSFTLNLHALMTVPIAFAMFDRQREDGSLTEDAIATLQALRENASRITLFSQAGQTGVPDEYRSLYVYLEDSIYPVVPPKADAIFHPKVWYLRYSGSSETDSIYRLLCLSRNLTFDRSWDTVLRLDGRLTDDIRAPELEQFAHSLIAMSNATRPLPLDRSRSIQALGGEFSRVEWRIPEGFDDVRFWPLGHDGNSRSPLPDSSKRVLIISPFLTQWPIDRMTKCPDPRPEQSIVLSRPESFELLGGNATAHLTERLVLSPDAASPEDEELDQEPSVKESVAESFQHTLHGLHAKLYVLDQGDGRSRILTGSANATWPGFHENVEFMVEMTGRTEQVGVEATIGDRNDRLGLRALVEPFEPSNDEPGELSDEERINFKLDQASRLFSSLRYTAACEHQPDDAWTISLLGAMQRKQELELHDFSLQIRPITLRMEPVTPIIDGQTVSATFTLSEEAVTPFFSFTLSMGANSTEFLVVAELLNPPPERESNVLRNLLKHPRDFVRLLLLLLGNIDDALAALDNEEGDGQSTAWFVGSGSDALLEPLVRAFSRDPERLRDIERLVLDLGKRSDGETVLPDGWWEIWTPIAQALESDEKR